MSGGDKAETQDAAKGERIAKVIARSGVCSRRDAERMIGEGRVMLNGRVLDTPAITVGPSDRIEIDGRPIAARERTRLWLFHKPKGLVTTNRDPEGRPTIFSALPKDMPRTLTVGRLDINTEGLLLLTNDGGLARVLELPSTGWLRRYRVRAHGRVEPAALEALKHGVTIDGMIYGGMEAEIDRQQGTNLWLTLGLREGKNREVKRVLEHLGLSVNRLIRISYGPFQVGDLEPGEVREIRGRVLRDQLGDRLAASAGADFDAPLRAEESERKPAARPRRAAAAHPSGGPHPSGARGSAAKTKPAADADAGRPGKRPPARRQADMKPADWRRRDSRQDGEDGPTPGRGGPRGGKPQGGRPSKGPGSGPGAGPGNGARRGGRADRRRSP